MVHFNLLQCMLALSLLQLAALSAPTAKWKLPLPVTMVYDFPAATWTENVAVRSNGQILATEDTAPRVWLVDPFAPDEEAVLLHEVHETASILGIVEGAPDVFYVCSANYSSKLLEGYGEGYIYRIGMTRYQPSKSNTAEVSKIATVSGAEGLDGLAFF